MYFKDVFIVFTNYNLFNNFYRGLLVKVIEFSLVKICNRKKIVIREYDVEVLCLFGGRYVN